VVPVKNPEIDQAKILPLQQNSCCVPQVVHNQSLLLLPAAHKSSGTVCA
jgi:hypothetical protein